MRFLIAVLIAFTYAFGSTAPFTIDQEVLRYAQQQYGSAGKRRIEELIALMNTLQMQSEKSQLEHINNFFNAVVYEIDQQVWGVKDYWATRTEFLGRDMGDCEDYVIAKYFTLRQLGISATKIYLTYVKAIKYNQAHMVLTYFPNENAEPLILDNLDPKILPASKRRDLLPIINFDGEKIYLAKQRGLGRILPSVDVNLKQWEELILKIRKETDAP